MQACWQASVTSTKTSSKPSTSLETRFQFFGQFPIDDIFIDILLEQILPNLGKDPSEDVRRRNVADDPVARWKTAPNSHDRLARQGHLNVLFPRQFADACSIIDLTDQDRFFGRASGEHKLFSFNRYLRR